MVASTKAGPRKREEPEPKEYRGREGLGTGRAMVWGHLVGVPEFGHPTVAPPGTVEKLLVFYARSKRREPLFHGWDARYEGCPMPYYFGLLDPADRDQVIAERRTYYTESSVNSLHSKR